ncbi:MAG: porin [Rickettsiales bacterium]|jgi:hypothetical protein|nr:porin [Rickettsiales bacterium]
MQITIKKALSFFCHSRAGGNRANNLSGFARLHTFTFYLLPFTFCLFTFTANASTSGSGYLTIGNLSGGNDKRPQLALDWQGRGEYSTEDFGLVGTINQASEKTAYFVQDAFVFADLGFGRAELGISAPIGYKLAVGLPDAGGLRINRSFMAYELLTAPNVLATPAVNSTQGKPRLTFSTKPAALQVGAGFAPYSNDMHGAFDLGARLKLDGRVKWAMSLGASHILKPHGLTAEIYAPDVRADSRTETSLGLNVQIDSWSLAAVAKAIYDDNPQGVASDGTMFGAGASYEILAWKFSINWMQSNTGRWHYDQGDLNNTGAFSVSNKLDESVDLWFSAGRVWGDETIFFWSASLRTKF